MGLAEFENRKIAYFSMEIGVDKDLPTYSGGLGVLAGDTIKSAADLKAPMVAVTLLYRKGYFNQAISSDGRQSESLVAWDPNDKLDKLSAKQYVEIEGRRVAVCAWKYNCVGERGIVPIIFLDTDLEENSKFDRTLTDQLYGGDNRYRLCQEQLLGRAGVKILNELIDGAASSDNGLVYHMNEGHAALLVAELLESNGGYNQGSLEKVKKKCVFTTHTPVAAGHDKFDAGLAVEVIGSDCLDGLHELGLSDGKTLNMTTIALGSVSFTNGVAKRHGEVSRQMFPGREISAVTNGVHAKSWTSTPMQKLFDEVIPAWKKDNNYFRDAVELDEDKLWKAHLDSKRGLNQIIKQISGVSFDENVFTVGFARRAATYKRADLFFHDPARLIELAERHGGLQIVFAGKAHPKDEGGKKLIENVVKAMNEISSKSIKAVYLENYGMELGLAITSGVDLWLNNPLKPLEASGTSGMKAALNGVPSYSTLDGWWVEGHIEGVTGWEIEDAAAGECGSEEDTPETREIAAKALYAKLDGSIMDMYYNDRPSYLKVMKNSIAINGSFFNTQRMVQQYIDLAYAPLY